MIFSIILIVVAVTCLYFAYKEFKGMRLSGFVWNKRLSVLETERYFAHQAPGSDADEFMAELGEYVRDESRLREIYSEIISMPEECKDSDYETELIQTFGEKNSKKIRSAIESAVVAMILLAENPKLHCKVDNREVAKKKIGLFSLVHSLVESENHTINRDGCFVPA